MGLKIAFINFNLRTKSLAHSINVSGAKILVVGQGKLVCLAHHNYSGPPSNMPY